ncbi:hypothetical protein [Endozoicomonas sp. SCSIO W0465]|uniref:hypothetical protein n=1 Tax=Endozoicomonas sp. SCSIO W0465 TaxID=2918516 RepID=UPI00207604EE|nr:hypothetical protein [Endozoicomonas sp. SCSIO W0465]USE37525.1 hypothetical protein MJO57_04715 [Endozoicomonas sp. SCSIO W0465]
MRRNSSVANNYEELFSDFPDIPASGGCLKTDCGPASLAIDDVTQWNAELERTMPGAGARLQQPEASEPEYTLFIAWSESNYGQNNSNMSYEITFEL